MIYSQVIIIFSLSNNSKRNEKKKATKKKLKMKSLIFLVVGRTNIEPNCQLKKSQLHIHHKKREKRDQNNCHYTITKRVMCTVHVSIVSAISERRFARAQKWKKNILKNQRNVIPLFGYLLQCDRPPRVFFFFFISVCLSVSCLVATMFRVWLQFLHLFTGI